MVDGAQDELPDAVNQRLTRYPLAGARHPAFVLLSTDADGGPRASLISNGEVWAHSRTQVSIALWPGSNTSRNIDRAGRALLLVMAPSSSAHVALNCTNGQSIDPAVGGQLLRFDCTVSRVKVDDVQYADMAAGPVIELVEPRPTLKRWNATLRLLRRRGNSPDQS